MVLNNHERWARKIVRNLWTFEQIKKFIKYPYLLRKSNRMKIETNGVSCVTSQPDVRQLTVPTVRIFFDSRSRGFYFWEHLVILLGVGPIGRYGFRRATLALRCTKINFETENGAETCTTLNTLMLFVCYIDCLFYTRRVS